MPSKSFLLRDKFTLKVYVSYFSCFFKVRFKTVRANLHFNKNDVDNMWSVNLVNLVN